MITKLQKWGNSHAVRLPKSAVIACGLASGDAVEVEVTEGVIRLRRVERRTFALNDLLARVKRSNLHGETDLGPPQGREIF